MTTWSPGDIMSNGVNIRYHRTGGNKPALLIAHGVTDNGLTWSRFARAIEDEYDVILYDRRGHGFSDAPETGYTFADHAQDMARLITALELDRPHVLGHSGGAVIAAMFAANHPHRLSSLILEDPAWGSGWGGWDEMTPGMADWFRETKAKTRPQLVAACSESNPNWLAEEVQLWADSKVQVSPHVVQTFRQPEPPWREIVGQITCPILLIVGDEDSGTVNTPEDVQAITSVWQQGRAVSLDGAGHVVHYDRFDAYLAAVKKFLAGIA